MRKLFVVLLAILTVAGLAVAQDVKPAVTTGSKSLDFTFAGIGAFGLGSPAIGGGLGATYFLSPDAAARIGLQVVNASSTTPANPPAGTPGTDGSQSAFQIGLGVDYLMFMTGATSRVRPFMGAGVQFGYATTNRKSVVIGAGTQPETKNDLGGENIMGTVYVAGLMVGARGVVGAEFFLYPELSISAEYQVNLFSLMSQADEEFVNGPTTVTTKGGSATTLLGFGSAGATLHIYF